MHKRTGLWISFACLLTWAVPALGGSILLRGKVMMQDGSAPTTSITVELFCFGVGTRIVANTTKTGQFLYATDVDSVNKLDSCVLRGSLKGYESTAVPISQLNPWSDPYLPAIILRERDASLGAENGILNTNIYIENSSVPPNARQPWSNAQRAMQKSDWPVAERQLQIVVKEAPKMAQAWHYLGIVSVRLSKPKEAAQAFEGAVNLDPKLTVARLGLLRAQLALTQWQPAEATALAMIKDKTGDKYPEIYTDLAIARYNLGNLDQAQADVEEALRRDTKHQTPRSEMVLATILESRGQIDNARQHMQRYLELDPRATDAATIRDHLNNLGKPTIAAAPPTPLTPLPEDVTPIDAVGEAWVPGGMRALARMARMPGEPAYPTFFEEYCRAVGREVSVGTSQGIPRFAQGLRAFLSTVAQLSPLGEKTGDNVIVRISPDRAQRTEAQNILRLLGWTIEERNGALHVEPGYRPEDALLQMVASALGIDQIAMQESLQAEVPFQFEIVSENARLIGGDLWNEIVRQEAVPPGGLPAIFATDLRITKACAGLNTMSGDTASLLISTVGLRNLAAKYGELLFRYGDAFSVTGGRVDVPGGPSADPVWQKLLGASPTEPRKFFRSLVDLDQGRGAAFYFTLFHADAAHQRYFTQSAERAEHSYRWFRDSSEFTNGILTHRPAAFTKILQQVPLDSSGNIYFPGGQAAWFPGTELPLTNPLLDALAPVAQLEKQHGKPFDADLASLLARNYAQWTVLYPYFENLPALDRDDYEALEKFSDALARRPAAERNAVLGEWYALVDLIARGTKAKSLDDAAAAHAFRQASLLLSQPDHATQSVALLRDLAGAGELEDAVATRLLRLDPVLRARFHRVLDLLHAPRLTEAPADELPFALSALVYASALDPSLLLLNEDPELLRRHRHATSDNLLFASAELHAPLPTSGPYFSGGFLGFEDAARTLMPGAKAEPRTPVVARSVPQIGSANDDEPTPDFSTDSKVVEVYTTVTDNRGRYIDDLTLDKFQLVDGQAPQSIVAFEPQNSDLSVALLLDTTGSMADTIASLKRAAMKLIDSLRPGDSVAVYSFSDRVTELAPYTTDRSITKRAVMNTLPFGNTALYDALARIGHEMTGRSGKKVVIVFTDGKDTASAVTVDAAIERSKVAGVPVYTIAQGEAVNNAPLIEQLSAISNATGGIPFQVRDPDDMAKVFDRVADDLSHGYLLFFQAPVRDGHDWRDLHVSVNGRKDLRIRARDGYYP